MKVIVNGQREDWHGIWPARKNSKRIVCVLSGSAHTGLEGAEYLGTHYSRISREEYDWYRLPAGTEIIRLSVDDVRANGAKGGRPVKRVQLINPWSGALPEDKNLAWDEIRAWAQGHVHPDDLPGWLRRARQAFRDNDGAELGAMIIGS